MYASILKQATRAFIRIAPLRAVLSAPFQAFLYHVYYRTHCPGSDMLVRDCVAGGECGCNNSHR